jgi:sulfonate transport system substrate-binding protein
MLLRAIQDQGWDPDRDVSIITQAPEVAGSALKAGHPELVIAYLKATIGAL